jgi:hypothetical protein
MYDRSTSKIPHLRQAVRLTGLGTPAFDAAVEAILAIHGIFSQSFENDTVEPWEPGEFVTYWAVDVWNRYFVSREAVADQTSLPFEKGVDPKRTLETLQGQHFLHTEENVVRYFHRIKESDGGFRYGTSNQSK